MTFTFKELDCQETPLGLISLRKRAEPRLDNRILYEVKLGDDYLMSSLFPEAEIQLSKLGLTALNRNGHKTELDIVVGGLGLGYTAAAALEDKNVASVLVIDIMSAVIDWHQRHLVPLGETLSTDPRSRLILGDFFDLATNAEVGFAPTNKPVHGIFLDIDHSPSNWLDEENSAFLHRRRIKQNEVEAPSRRHFLGCGQMTYQTKNFTSLLESVFDKVETEIIPFHNPYSGGESTNSVYLAHIN